MDISRSARVCSVRAALLKIMEEVWGTTQITSCDIHCSWEERWDSWVFSYCRSVMCMVHAGYWSIGAWILPPAHIRSFLRRIKLLALKPVVGGNQALGPLQSEAQLLFHVSDAVSKGFIKANQCNFLWFSNRETEAERSSGEQGTAYLASAIPR